MASLYNSLVSGSFQFNRLTRLIALVEGIGWGGEGEGGGMIPGGQVSESE